MRIEILTIGDELLDGVIADTNAQWLGQCLLDHGLTIVRSTSVRDDIESIKQVMLEVSTRADVCLCTGGLGPTNDDLTVDALAAALAVDCAFDDVVWADIVTRYGSTPPPVNNRRQARVPVGAEALRSTVGTAPGLKVRVGRCSFFLFPGVPRELRWHVRTYLDPFLSHQASTQLFKKTLRFTGIGESNLAESVEALAIPNSVALAYRTALPENHIRLSGPNPTEVDDAAALIVAHHKKCFVGFDEMSLARTVLNLCRARGLTLSTAESCTGGLIAAELTSIPGASATFTGCIVSYSNAVKMEQLGVSATVLDTAGAVSEACAMAMAEGVAKRLKSDIGISITGIAGPGGARPGKPVGTICFGWYGPGLKETRRVHLRGDRDRIRVQSMGLALDRIRREYAG